MLYPVSADALQRFRLMLDTPAHKELSVGEQRYKAVMAVLSGGRTVTEVARDWDASRQISVPERPGAVRVSENRAAAERSGHGIPMV